MTARDHALFVILTAYEFILGMGYQPMSLIENHGLVAHAT